MDLLLETVLDLLEAYGFATDRVPGDPPLGVAMRSTSQATEVFLYCHVGKEPKYLVIHALLPFHVPVQRQPDARAMLRELEHRLSGVKLVFREPEGLVECRATGRIGTGQLAQLQIDQLVAHCLDAIERCGSLICAAEYACSEQIIVPFMPSHITLN